MKATNYQLTEDDRRVLRVVQKHFGFSTKPFDEIATKVGMSTDSVLKIMQNLADEGFITRTGPFFNLDRSSGYVSLVAMKVPEERFAEVTEVVNAYEEVAHNYKRKHELNMWFVLGVRSPERAFAILNDIERKTGLRTFNLPKLKEFNLDLYLEV